MWFLSALVPLTALSIPIIAIVLSHKRKSQAGRIREMELQKEILLLEIAKQDSRIKLLEEENKKYDRIIDGGSAPPPPRDG
jgi:hypothetical protein